jgi:hypothetical protein
MPSCLVFARIASRHLLTVAIPKVSVSIALKDAEQTTPSLSWNGGIKDYASGVARNGPQRLKAIPRVRNAGKNRIIMIENNGNENLNIKQSPLNCWS